MRYGDVCTGISAATVAWHGLGWTPAFFSEIEPFPCKLLQHYYPHVPNVGDMNKILSNQTFIDADFDVLVGGTPCQSFSVAGLRGGLTDQRGNLALQYCRILIAKRPRWFVWENVPGVFSSFSNETESKVVGGTGPEHERFVTETADFATLLAAFQQCGYSCAWRVLDAQFFGVPQRRRRVFVVGYFGNDWRPPAAVLFDAKGSAGNIKARAVKGENLAGALTARINSDSFGTDDAFVNHLLPIVMATGQAGAEISTDIVPTLNCNHEQPILAYPLQQIASPANRSNPKPGDPSPSLTTQGRIIIAREYKAMVRRITPLECERLQGFPDNYTNIPGASDTVRYNALGNSMAVPVMHWLGRRIKQVGAQMKA